MTTLGAGVALHDDVAEAVVDVNLSFAKVVTAALSDIPVTVGTDTGATYTPLETMRLMTVLDESFPPMAGVVLTIKPFATLAEFACDVLMLLALMPPWVSWVCAAAALSPETSGMTDSVLLDFNA
jgi:hypothetical protein